jgi:hypothetical protein
MIQGFLINMPQFLPPAQVIIHFLSKTDGVRRIIAYHWRDRWIAGIF